jgi:hypothetical protein
MFSFRAWGLDLPVQVIHTDPENCVKPEHCAKKDLMAGLQALEKTLRRSRKCVFCLDG